MATNTSQIPDMSNVLGSSWFGKLKFVGILLIVLYLFKSTLIFIPRGMWVSRMTADGEC